MYHEMTSRDRTRKRRSRLLVAAIALACAIVLVVAINAARLGAREQGAVAMRKSILDAAVRCCAIEGSYPLTLSHLEECYGLRINHRDYVVTYEAYASNIAPSVVVVPR